jgi:hypothetical protein
MEVRGFAFTRLTTGLPFSQRFSGRCAYLVLLSASREFHANISTESQYLGAGLPLFSELPRRGFSETQLEISALGTSADPGR